MSLQINCRKIVGGSGKGKALVTHQPINFLTMINAKKGTIDQRNHELFGEILNGIVLVLPYAVGSSVGAYTIYSLKANQLAPGSNNMYREGRHNYCIRVCNFKYSCC